MPVTTDKGEYIHYLLNKNISSHPDCISSVVITMWKHNGFYIVKLPTAIWIHYREKRTDVKIQYTQ